MDYFFSPQANLLTKKKNVDNNKKTFEVPLPPVQTDGYSHSFTLSYNQMN